MTVTSADAAPPASPLAAQAGALARKVYELAREVGRDDLLNDLVQALQATVAPRVVVVVCGERESQKRALVNALLGRPGLLPAQEDVTTAAHVLIRATTEGEQERLLAHLGQGEPLQHHLSEIARLSTETAVAERGIRYLEVALDHPLLAAGIVLVDTPGLGGLGRARGQLVLSSLTGADSALLVVDGGAPITALELGFLSEAAQRVDDLVVALDRNDRQHGWRTVKAETEEHLARLDSFGGRSAVIPLSARMKTRGDRLAVKPGADAELGRELAEQSGTAALADRLMRLTAERAGALRAARLCRLSDAVVERLRSREEEVRRSADQSTEELRRRLQEKQDARETFAHDLPALRRRLNNELRLVQKDADAASVTLLNGVRRGFDKRLAEGETEDLAEDLEAELLKALEASLEDVRERMTSSSEEMASLLGAHGAALQLDRAALEPGAVPALTAVELPPSSTGKGEWMARAPFAAGALVLNPVYAVVAVAGLLFDRRRVHKRVEREQLSRQIVETVNEARAQLSVAVHHALVNGQAALTEAFEEVAAARRDELDEEAGAIKAQVSLSESERTRAANEAEGRLARLEDVRTRLAETRQGALGALSGGRRAAAPEAAP